MVTRPHTVKLGNLVEKAVRVNRPGFVAAFFFEKDGDYAHAVSPVSPAHAVRMALDRDCPRFG
jgi:hypothetical protein